MESNPCLDRRSLPVHRRKQEFENSNFDILPSSLIYPVPEDQTNAQQEHQKFPPNYLVNTDLVFQLMSVRNFSFSCVVSAFAFQNF